MNFSRFSSSRLNLSDLFINEKCRLQSLEIEEDDEETATLRRLNQENRVLLVQLDAAHEALFSHQRKTQNTMERFEEDTQDLNRNLSQSVRREEIAMDKIKALEIALQEMQSEKQLIQRKAMDSLEDLAKTEGQKQSELEDIVQKLNHELEQKEEENIRLCMTILKVQEDLSKENHLKEGSIEDRDRTILKLEKALDELRLENESRNMTESYCKNEENLDPETEQSTISSLQKKVEIQDIELQKLRKENHELKEKLTKSEHISVLTNGHDQISTSNNFVQNDQTKEIQEVDKLQCRLRESEDTCRKTQERADHMTYLLNQKIIELNKLQLALSGQTKEMIQLEKAYFQLRCHLSKGFRTPSSSRSSRVDLSTST